MTEVLNAAIDTTPKTTELVPVGGDERVAYHLQKSGFFKTELRSISQGVAKILLGRSLGIDPASSVMGLFISSQGKLTLSANLMARCIKAYKEPETNKTKYRLKFKERTTKVCEIEVWERYEETAGSWVWECMGSERVTIEQFKHLQKNSVWTLYPTNMLFARCVSNVAKMFCADVFGGSSVYTPCEVPGDGFEVDGETLEVKAAPTVIEAVDVEFVVASGPNAKKLQDVMQELKLSFEDVGLMFGQTPEQLKVSTSSEEGAGKLINLLAFRKKV